MRCWAIVVLVVMTMPLPRAASAAGDEDQAGLQKRVETIIAELADLQPTVRERADVKLRNLPLPAYPIVTKMYEKEKENLDPEAKLRIQNSIEMFKALAAIDQRKRKVWNWLHENSLKAYDQGSSRDPKWDEPARRAIDLSTLWDQTTAQVDQMTAAFKQAADAGCDDPLFTYYYARFYAPEGGSNDQKQLELLTQALEGIYQEAAYPAGLKCAIACRAQALMLRRPDLHAGKFFHLLPYDMTPSSFLKNITPQDGVPDQLLYEMAELITRQNGNDSAKYWYEEVKVAFERCVADPVYRAALKGACYRRDALSDDPIVKSWGSKVKPRPASREARQAAAQAELEKAYAINPLMPMVSMEMLRLELDRGADDQEVQRWFKRTLAANPDDVDACWMMLEELAVDEKLAFGRQFLAGQNWRGRLPLILVWAHEAVGNSVDDKTEYWQRKEVWAEIKQVYETELAYFPERVEDRSNLARLANRCGQWAEADKQFRILGDKPSLRVFGSMTSYNYQRKKAAKNVAAMPEPREK